MDYSLWGGRCNRWYGRMISTIDQLKHVLAYFTVGLS